MARVAGRSVTFAVALALSGYASLIISVGYYIDPYVRDGMVPWP